jgi:hypothetical protein
VIRDLASDDLHVSLARVCRIEREMNLKIVLFLIAAASLEAFGDAVVRMGIGQTAWLPRSALFLAGAFLLFGYGLSLNLAPIEFSRVVGLYIATLFIIWQLVNLIVFRSPPGVPVLFGGLLIVAGGLVVTFWE